MAAFAFGCSAVVEPQQPFDEVSQAFTGPVPDTTLYRGYKYWCSWPSCDGDHFLTTDSSEATNAGYASDGPIGQCWTNTDGARLPLYRLNNPNTHDHLYTLDNNEAQTARNSGMVPEGITCYLYLQRAFPDMQPLYRFYSSDWSEHLYTTSESERSHLSVAGSGWSPEGIAGYLYPGNK